MEWLIGLLSGGGGLLIAGFVAWVFMVDRETTVAKVSDGFKESVKTSVKEAMEASQKTMDVSLDAASQSIKAEAEKVAILFREKNHHCGEQKESCKDKFETHCDADEEYRTSNDKRVGVVESDVKVLLQKGGN